MATPYSGQGKQQTKITVKYKYWSNLKLMIVTLALNWTAIAILMNCLTTAWKWWWWIFWPRQWLFQ